MGGQGVGERRIEVFEKIKKNGGGGSGRGGRGVRVGGVRVGGVRVEGGHGGCERRIEVFVKIQKKKYFFFVFVFFFWGGGGMFGGVRVDVNEELKFWGKFTKEIWGKGGREGVSGGGSDWWGVRVDVNAMLRVGGDVGYGRCEPKKEGIVQCTEKVLYNIKKIKKMCVWGGGGGGEGDRQYLNPKYSLCKKN